MFQNKYSKIKKQVFYKKTTLIKGGEYFEIPPSSEKFAENIPLSKFWEYLLENSEKQRKIV